MKRTYLLPLLVAAFALALGGCKKKEEAAPEGDEAAAAKPAEGDEAAKPDEAAKEGDEAANEGDEAANEGDEAANEGDEAAAADGSGIQECDDYFAAVEKYASCDKLPPAAADAAKKGVEQMKASMSKWDENVPDETKKATADGCKNALEALKKGAEPLGCEL